MPTRVQARKPSRNWNIVSEKPLFTQTFEVDKQDVVLMNGLYVYNNSGEDRSVLASQLVKNKINILELKEYNETSFRLASSKTENTFNLSVEQDLKALLLSTDGVFYIDITSMPNHIWAPILRVAFKLDVKIKVIYCEPKKYNLPTRYGASVDYSVSQQLKQLPGFVVLKQVPEQKICFVPLLGFEKTRFELLMNKLDPIISQTFPIIGLPGFRIEYPFESYFFNKNRLDRDLLWQNIHYSTAHCPFSLFYLLSKLSAENKSKFFRIGLIGTKPHTLGAVMFYLHSKAGADLIYDYPAKRINKSTGLHKFHIYHVDLFDKFLKNI